MPGNSIRAVVFDLGGTLEDVYYDDTVHQEATRGLLACLVERGLDPGLSLADLQTAVLSGMKAYQEWRERSEVELSPERVWGEFVFGGADPADSIGPAWRRRLEAAADDLAFFYETHYQLRSVRTEAPATVRALHERGFGLALISNIISYRTVEHSLRTYGIAQYFDPILTSARCGFRKPDVRIFLEAARLMHLPPAACAYVGDTISRDVIGARRAGYGLAVQIKSFLTDKADRGRQGASPDAVIDNLARILDLVDSAKGADRGH